jgi:hypothetical protein
MQYPLCRHIKTNGTQCQAPALTAQDHCFFHRRLYQRHAGFRHTDRTRGYLVVGQHIELAPLEDRESVQLALSMVINALATGHLETKRATALLYGLQIASHNVTGLRLQPFAPDAVLSVETDPDGLELAQPGATLTLPDTIGPAHNDYDPNELNEDENDEEDEEEEEEEEYEEKAVENQPETEEIQPEIPRSTFELYGHGQSSIDLPSMPIFPSTTDLPPLGERPQPKCY